MYGSDVLCGTFEIPHKISFPYIDWCWFYPQVKIQEVLDLRAQKCFWNAPRPLRFTPYTINISGKD